MTLKHLELKSFRSFKGVNMPIDGPRVLISGLNGSGKTSCRNAIRWALTGRCDGTDERGAGAEVLIPVGEKVAEVVVTLGDKIGPVARSYAERGGGAMAVFGFTGTSQIQQMALYTKLNTTPAFLDAVLDTEAFLDLDHVKAKALVLSLLDVKIQVGATAYTLDELDVRYKQAFEDRKVAKVALQRHLLPPEPADVKMPSIETIEKQLAALRAALGQAQQAAGEVIGKRQTMTRDLAVVTSARHDVGPDLSQQIASLEETLAALETAAVPQQAPPPKEDPNRLLYLTQKKNFLSQHHPENGCVLYGKVQCLTPGKQFQMALHEVQEELKTLEPPPASASQESPLTTARRRLADCQAKQEQRNRAIAGGTEAMERAAGLREALASLPDTAAQESEIATLQSRIAKGEQLLRDARAYWTAAEAYKLAVDQRKTLSDEVERLETLVELLGPKGARVKALEDAMARFLAAVNPYLKPFGWKLGISVDPWEVFANKRPVETYSKSERHRIGIAVQLAIAMLSGLKFCVIDELDVLDVGNRNIVTKMLLESPLEQIIILSTRETSQALPKVPGLIAFRLEAKDGQTKVAERVAA